MGIRLRMFHGDTAVEVEADKAQDILEVLHGARTRERPPADHRALADTRHTLLDAMRRYICDCTTGRTSEVYAETIAAASVHIDPATVCLGELTLSWVGWLDSLMREREGLRLALGLSTCVTSARLSAMLCDWVGYPHIRSGATGYLGTRRGTELCPWRLSVL